MMQQQPMQQQITTTTMVMGGGGGVVTEPLRGPGTLKIQVPTDDELFMLCACCCNKYSIYHKFPECMGVTIKNECCCSKNALQGRCAFAPVFRYTECEDSCLDFRPGMNLDDAGGCEISHT